MARLDVQPKKKSSWLIWALIALIAVALLLFWMRSCNNDNTVVVKDADSASSAPADHTGVDENDDWWKRVDFNGPEVHFDEITDKDVTVRSNDEYSVYGLDEAILFSSGKNTIREDARQKLQQIAASATKRFSGGSIRVYGHTDASGSTESNMKLAKERANAVKNWLVSNANISEQSISVHPIGEARPAATNQTAQGRQQNRRVEIVIRHKN